MQFHEVANIFPLMEGVEFNALVDDIREHGQREPIWAYQGKIIDGRNRFRACQEIGIEPLTVEWDGEGSLTAFVVSLNLHRRHLNPSQQSMVGGKIKPLFEAEARERQRGGQGGVLLVANLPQAKSRELAAEAVGVSPRSIEYASKVLEDGTPELEQAVMSGQASVSAAALIAELPKEEQKEIVARGEMEILRAAKDIRARKTEQRRAERIESIKTEFLAPTGDVKYPVIYADPPWRYDFAETDNREIENQYPTMELDEICALPVAELATPDSILFMWATSPKLEEAFKVINSWGFEYKTCMVWAKDKIGMGYYARQQHEILLIAKRGQLPPPEPQNRPASIVSAPRSKHSAKPVEFYELIERMYPEFPKVELFCRTPREGWTVWGNEVAA